MIIKNKQGNDILKGGETRIAFAVNTEGCNDSGFAGRISRSYWPELAYIGECELGTVLTKTSDDGITFYALVCHSLEESSVMPGFEFLVGKLHKYDEPFLLSGEQLACTSDTFHRPAPYRSVHLGTPPGSTRLQRSHVSLMIQSVLSLNISLTFFRNIIMHGLVTRQTCPHLGAVSQPESLHHTPFGRHCERHTSENHH